MEEKAPVKKNLWRRIFRIVAWIVASWVALLFSIILVLNIPAVQTYITGIVSKSVSKKTGAEVRVGTVKIIFPKTIRIGDVYAAGKHADTLLYLDELRLNVDLFQLLRNKIRVKKLHIDGLVSHISRKAPENEFNFQFMLDAFASTDTLSKPEKSPSKPWTFDVRAVELNKITASYYDDVVGINARLDLGELYLFVKTLDPINFDFQAEQIEIVNTDAFVEMWEVAEALQPAEIEVSESGNKDTAAYSLPVVGLGLLCLENFRGRYQHRDEQMDFSAEVGTLEFRPEKIDLNRQELDLGELFLENSTFLASMSLSNPDQENLTENVVNAEDAGQSSLFPDWNIKMKRIGLVGIDAKFDDISAPKTASGIDYGHFAVKDLNLETGVLSVSPASATADIQNMVFTEQSGLNLTNLRGQFEVTNQSAFIQSLLVETSESSVMGDFMVGFESVEALQKNPGNSEVSINLENLKLNTKDVFLLFPDLASDSILGQYNDEVFIAKAEALGKINNLNIKNLDLWLFDFTKLKARGRLTGIPEISGLGFDVTLKALSTNLADLKPFLDTALTNSHTLPENYLLKGVAKGKLDDLTAQITVNTTFGDISAGAFFQKNTETNSDTFNIDFNIVELMAGRILADTTFGNLNLSGTLAGTGAMGDSLRATANLQINEAGYNHYVYKNIAARAKLDGKKYEVEIISDDPNLDFDLKASVDQGLKKQKYAAQLNLGALNLSALHFMEDELVISTSVSANANFESSRNMDVNLAATGTSLVLGKIIAPVDSLEMNASYSENVLKADLKSDVMDATMNANFEPQKMDKILMAMLRKYLGITGKDTVLPGYEMAFNLDVHLSNNIKRLIGNEFDLSEIKNMQGFYNSDNNEMSVEMQLDKVVFGLVNLDSLILMIDGKDDSVSFSFDCRKISYDTLKIQHFSITETLKKGVVLSEVKISDNSGIPRYLFHNKLHFSDSAINVAFLPGGLILDNRTWSVEDENLLKIKKEGVESQNFSFSSRNETIGFSTVDDIPILTFDKFDIQNLLNIVEAGRQNDLLRGRLDGQITFPAKDNPDLFSCNLKIDSLFLLDSLAGQVSFQASADSSNLALELILKNDQNKISAFGDIASWNENPQFDLSVQLDVETLQTLEKYAVGQLSEMNGKVTGNISITGTPDDPDVIGVIDFENTRMKINSLNFRLMLKKDQLTFDKNGLHFKDFILEDAGNQQLTVNGSILTKNYSDFIFDMSVLSKNFQPVNSTAANNKAFYGDLFIDTDIKLKGTLDNPEIDATIKINKGTNLTYAMAGSELQLITPEGIVHFVDPAAIVDSATISIAGDYITDSIMSRISGIDLTTNLEIDEEAKFTVLIDPRSGDYLSLGGRAILSIAVDPAGNQTITGIYEVKSGVYQLSFYGLVKKTFTIQQGSNISWSGKAMDASLNITALYEVTTNSVALVANETSSMSESEKNIYKQRLPYTVLLNINGFITQPEIGFNITLPDKYRVNYPQVASKLDQLNTGEMESERNKQVFALLVTGGFLADNPFASTGSSTANIATTAARNSVNGILADQLNNISSKFVKNVDLNFGLNSYEDYSGQSSEIRTELEVQVTKKLFNDRLTIEAQGYFDVEGSNKNNYNSQSSQQMWGEFAVIYDLTSSGEYKLRAFRENAYDFFDGEVAYSGIAFIFEKEFDHLLSNKKGKNENSDSLQRNQDELKNKEPKPGKE